MMPNRLYFGLSIKKPTVCWFFCFISYFFGVVCFANNIQIYVGKIQNNIWQVSLSPNFKSDALVKIANKQVINAKYIGEADEEYTYANIKQDLQFTIQQIQAGVIDTILVNHKPLSKRLYLVKSKNYYDSCKVYQYTKAYANDAISLHQLLICNGKPVVIALYENRGKPSYNSCELISNQVKAQGKSAVFRVAYDDFNQQKVVTKYSKIIVIPQNHYYQAQLSEPQSLSKFYCGYGLSLPSRVEFSASQ